MTSKTLSILSYVTIFGWLISFFFYRKEAVKQSLTSYHLEQGLGIFIVSAALTIILRIIGTITPSLAAVLSLSGYAVIILWIFGIINAINERKKPIPLVGKMFEGKFKFIS